MYLEMDYLSSEFLYISAICSSLSYTLIFESTDPIGRDIRVSPWEM
jgi:hypothetical protein